MAEYMKLSINQGGQPCTLDTKGNAVSVSKFQPVLIITPNSVRGWLDLVSGLQPQCLLQKDHYSLSLAVELKLDLGSTFPWDLLPLAFFLFPFPFSSRFLFPPFPKEKKKENVSK